MMRKTATFVFLLLTSLALPRMAAAEDVRRVLGSDNTLFELYRGTYGELFEGGTAADGASFVLALDVVRDGARERWLVPGTGTVDVESSQILVYERESDQLYLFWESLSNGIHPRLHLIRFDGAEWGELIELAGSPFARKRSLQLVVSRVPSGSQAASDLTVLHVFWAEERPMTSVKRYAPITLIAGNYIGWTPVYDLHALGIPGEPSRAPLSEGIVDSLRGQRGKNRQSVAVGYLNPESHLLTTLEIELLPPILTAFADKARLEILPFGQNFDSFTELADAIPELLAELGGDIHPAVLEYISARVRRLVVSSGMELTEENLIALAELIWAEIIAVVAAVGENGLADSEDFQLVEISPRFDTEASRQLLKVTAASDREAPEVGGEATLWLSESARHVLVTWEDEERIYFRESLDEGGWSEIASIEIGNGLERDQIYLTLSERIRNR